MTDMTAEQALEMLADMAHMEAEEYAKAGGGGRVESLQAIIRQALTAPRVPGGWRDDVEKRGFFRSADELADWLDSLCDIGSDGEPSYKKWGPAKVAASAVRSAYRTLTTAPAPAEPGHLPQQFNDALLSEREGGEV